MFDRSRRAFILSTGACLAPNPLPAAAPLDRPPADALQDWIAGHAVAVRSIDARDEDFADLEPLVKLISSARVVQLGEPSHGAGSSFAAKARLVKFLHQRMGFDVVAWESGFYDVELTEAGLRAGEAAVASAQRGILKIWSASEECRPLFEYAGQSHATPRPLAMAGFDMQFTGREGFDHFAAALRGFVGAVREPGLRRDAGQAANEALEAFGGFNAHIQALAARAAEKPPLPKRETLERLRQAVARLAGLFDGHMAAFAEILGERRRGFMSRAVANLGGFGANLYEKYGVDDPGGPVPQVVQSNRRDALMAQNLRWLIEDGYPGRRVIVWGHNAHLMNAYYQAPDFTTVRLGPAPDTMKPVGVFLADWLGDDVYTIGFTAYEGEDGWVGGPAAAVPPARDGGLEARLHRLGLPHTLLDMRGARGVAGHPLREPLTMRVPKYDEIEIADPTRPYDAVFYIARMKPATLIR